MIPYRGNVQKEERVVVAKDGKNAVRWDYGDSSATL